MVIGICLITFLATVTNKRKIQTIEKNISTPSMPLNDSTSPKEENGKDTFSSFQEEKKHEQGKPINSDLSSSL